MKILIVSSYLPFPLYSGGAVRLYNIIKALSLRHDITLVCEKRVHQSEEDVMALRSFCKQVLTVDRKKQWSLKNIVTTGFSTKPFLVTGHRSMEMKQAIKKLLDETLYDLIHIETFYVFQNVPRTILPTVLVEHNIEYLVYERYAKTASPVLKPLLFTDVMKLKKYETSIWEKTTKLIAVSEEEKGIMGNDAVVIPNGVDTDKFKMKTKSQMQRIKEKRILFIGDFTWLQNRDAVKFLLEEVWPSFIKVAKGKPFEKKVTLWIVGKNMPEELKRFADSDKTIIMDENASDDTAKIFEKSYLLLAPIRIGGGTSFKILEAMASGVPVITSALGAEGIAGDQKTILTAETADEYVQNITLLLTNEKQYTMVSESGRKRIEEHFDWKEIVGKLETVYKEAIEKNAE